MARVLFAVVIAGLLAVLVLVFLYPQAMIGPGVLIKGHAPLDNECFACHTPFLGSRPEKCIACHGLDRIGLFTTRGAPLVGKRVAFHQKLLEQDCIACHSDHAGLVTAHGRSIFSHGLLRADVLEQCDSCHLKPGDGLHRNILENCSACHTIQAWLPADFDHDPYFRLNDEHDAKCTICHVRNDYRSYTCYGCHEHSRARILAEHLEEGIHEIDNCVRCHRNADEVEAGEGHDD